MAATPSASELALDPEWLPHEFQADGKELTSVFVPGPARDGLLFLTEGHLKANFRRATLPVAAIASELDAAERAPLHFIFNTSFCCSTLLVKALEVPGVSTALKEPNILVDVANRLGCGQVVQGHRELELALRLLERPLAPGERVIAKPSNFANRLIEPALALRPQSRAVLLYSDPGTYLRSVVKRGLLARINARKLYQNLATWTELEFGFAQQETFEQTDVQIAALAWLMQIAQFRALASKLGAQRVLLVDAVDLLADPCGTLRRVQSLFGLGLSEAQLDDLVRGPAFSTHSKFSEVPYDQHAREREHDALMQVHGEELRMVLHWLEAVASHVGVPLRPAARTT
jgi:hypothetical protein